MSKLRKALEFVGLTVVLVTAGVYGLNAYGEQFVFNHDVDGVTHECGPIEWTDGDKEKPVRALCFSLGSLAYQNDLRYELVRVSSMEEWIVGDINE